jgi:hypothetical protein
MLSYFNLLMSKINLILVKSLHKRNDIFHNMLYAIIKFVNIFFQHLKIFIIAGK